MTHAWPDVEDLLVLLAEWTGSDSRIRDGGILYSIAARPHAVVIERIYPTAVERASALLHAAIRWRPLEMWNAGLGWAAARVCLESAGIKLTMPAKERMELTDELAAGDLDTVEEIALRLAPHLAVAD